MDDLRMPLDDVETLKSGEPWSWTWYDSVYKPVFHSRKCDRCGVVKETLGAYIGGTVKPATYLVFGYPVEIVERMMIALRLDSLCEPCYLKLRFNGSGVPPKLSELRAMRKKGETDG